MDISGISALASEMARIAELVGNQRAHEGHLSISQQSWRDMATGLSDTSRNLTAGADSMAPVWQDAAGQLYGEGLREGAAKVDTWHQTMTGANVPAALEGLVAAIREAVTKVDALVEKFNTILTQLETVTDAAGVAAVEGQLAAVVQAAAAELMKLDQRFAETATVVSSAANGEQGAATTAAGGPGASGGAAAGGPSATTPGSGAQAPAAPGAAGAGAPPVGAGAGGAGGAGGAAAPAPVGAAGGAGPGGAGAAPSPVVPGATAPSLSGLSAPPPITSPNLPSPSIPSPVVPPSGSAVPPFIPPVGSVGRGAAPKLNVPTPLSSIPRVSGIGAAGAGIGVPGPLAGAVGTPKIARAANPGTASAPPTSGQAPAAPAPSGGAAAGSSRSGIGGMPMMPMSGAGAGGRGGGAPKPGDADGDGHKARPPRTVPGVPARLRGRAGKLDASATILGSARSTGNRPEPTDPEPPQLLDGELWEVTPTPQPDVTTPRHLRA